MKPAFVAPHPEGQKGHNVLVLEVVDVVIPLEADLDEDPDHPDTLRLRREDGAYEAVLKGDDPDVEPDGDNPLFIRLTQEAGVLAWTSPIYFFR